MGRPDTAGSQQLIRHWRGTAAQLFGMAAGRFPRPEASVLLGRIAGCEAPPSVLRALTVVRRGPGAHRAPRRPWRSRAAVPAAMAAVCLIALAAVLMQRQTAPSRPAVQHSTALPAPAPAAPVAPPAVPAVAGGPAPSVPAGTEDAAAGAGVRSVAVRRGDTLWGLARRHHTTVQTLQELNGLGTSTLILAGATLRLPAGAAAPEASPAPASGTTSPTPGTTASPAPATGSAPAGDPAVAFALAQVGKPYRWGAAGPDAFDCSGLVMRAWQRAGVTLPRTTWDMLRSGTAVARADLRPGDLVLTNGGGHVQLYLGDGKVVHAPGTGRSVTITALPSDNAVTAYRRPGPAEH
ncbi:C40 family peptidase [Kitasatospora cheerisanensis]|uniref:Uncharacterized protein n=1 Tax=Kitasatospora cheerisanensis KCTC 2395 TaxID=1348663 RepID=A0A066YQW0_9ACTN|nr:NlpC/P60 family protein [Kitasatospora cheerisanensis]KDN80476.1 hypothetical protein KCH_77640 [Kitasatospora cheerisanensis KCTC 2395]